LRNEARSGLGSRTFLSLLLFFSRIKERNPCCGHQIGALNFDSKVCVLYLWHNVSDGSSIFML
jgi:hypothetical protein